MRKCALRAHAERGLADGDKAVYEWIKAFHVIAVIAWMAGMLYLPRLFVYHCGPRRVEPVGDLQGRWSAGCSGHHQPRDDRRLGLWLWLGPVSSAGCLGLAAGKDYPGSRLPACTAIRSAAVKDFAADRNRALAKILPDYQ